MERAGTAPDIVTARELGVIGCQNCSHVWRAGTRDCARCGAPLTARDPMSLQRVWAWWLIGLICYIPANMFPMLSTRTLFLTSEDTIVGGAVTLFEHGSYGISLVIIVASVVIPIGKFLAIAFLATSVQRRSLVPQPQRHALYEIVEYIGRWSMIDVFVVAILSSLVQLNTLASVTPGPASLFFALSVIFTMLSAQSFDSRLIWDLEPDAQKGSGPK
ncbi:Intermembrane transport protein PqiA (plasmid) [Pseudoseohaeicola sp. NH-UV-7]|uniref:paraquat-inducible protein A n=1 Tax=unclassified Sulfitobacter TaxID=196795 RepID=UPI001966AB59|nr:paraquat-inducible protein A [Sulfitobacter sp. JL08]